MAEKNDLRIAAEAIETALKAFVLDSETQRVHVFESQWGNLRAVVGSARFENMGIGERQEAIWKHLRERVDPKYRVYCYGVHPMDPQEYEEHFSPPSAVGSSDAPVSPGVPGDESDV